MLGRAQKKHSDVSVTFSEFSKKSLERWKTMSDKQKGKFEDMAKYHSKIQEHPGLSIGDVAMKLGDMWNNTAADDKQPYERKAAKLTEKYKKDIAAYQAKGKPDMAKRFVKAEKERKRMKRKKIRKMKRMRKKRKIKKMNMKRKLW
ncbi:High mobility group protein B1 [Sciurus carolinensis]|uniref:High mobility group protein B1 n=1 Tax=Sciurus carolinensis TaxID=30640 RepID=A0AA41NGS3_SCICA|nr:High mobility group protein B1 [Sciurus carolinensis]